ncbi:hypothetical protein [Nostoc sp.]
MKFQRFVLTLVVSSLLVNNISPVLAGFSIFGIEVPDPGQLGKKKAEELALQKASELLGKEATVYYNVKNAYKKIEAPKSFNPQYVSVSSVADINRKLPPGDYWINIVTYCSHVTIAHSGSNMAHAIAPAEGKMVTLLANLTLRGEVAHVSHAKLQKLKWIIQTGLPLSQWLPEDRTVVHQLIPDFEKDLKGDTIDEMQANYAAFQKQFPILPGFEDVLRKIPFGKQVIAMRNARKVLTEKGIADRQVGGRLFEVTDPGNTAPPKVIAPEDSPWYQINDYIIARAVITHEVPVRGYSTTQDLQDDSQLGINRFEFRILDNSQKKEIKGSQKVAFLHVALAGITISEILFGGAIAGAAVYSVNHSHAVITGAAGNNPDDLRGIAPAKGGLILYPINHPAQPLSVTPTFGNGGGKNDDCSVSNVTGNSQKHDLQNPGDLNPKEVSNFKDGEYTRIVTDKPTRLYRVWGDDALKNGGYWTTTPITEAELKTPGFIAELQQKFAIDPASGK